MSGTELRTYLDAIFLLTAAACTVMLAYQGWRKVPEARPLAVAIGILLVQALFRLAVSGAPAAEAGLGRGAGVPVADRMLGTLFLILLVYGLVRPLFPAYRVPLYWLLGSYLAFLIGLSAMVYTDLLVHPQPGLRFAAHWGAIAFEMYQTPLLVASAVVMAAVWKASRSSYALIVLAALLLWVLGHAVHLGGLVSGQDTPVGWGNFLRAAEIAALVLAGVAIFVPDPARRSLSARYLADAESLLRGLRVQVEQLTTAKAALEERERLARELHDSVSQSLFSIELNAGAAEALLEKDPAKARERITRLRGAAHEALGDLRALIAELHPPALEGKTVAAALCDYANALEEREGLDVTVEADEAGELDPEAQAELFRIGYEALTNVVKHARAHRVWVELVVRPPSFRLRVADDGVGLGPGGPGEARTFGLSGMKQRAAILGARLTLGPAPEGGAQVLVERQAGP